MPHETPLDDDLLRNKWYPGRGLLLPFFHLPEENKPNEGCYEGNQRHDEPGDRFDTNSKLARLVVKGTLETTTAAETAISKG
mmetsp:Transcript_30214/g.70759  ORF Transcript_30214/g.70759 Transcript_30214/m.70759 type:complete len:82 (-) Transcript_30214:103-348(-)